MMTNDGKSTAQFTVLKQRANVFARAILQILMQRYNAPTAYNCYYIASIGYTLAATRLSINQCKIQSPIICATLNKIGINRNVTRVIVFGPKHLGGMFLSHLHTLQGIRRLQYFIGHIASNDGVGKLIRICVEATQLEEGPFEPFLFVLHSIHGHYNLTSTWLHELWSFLLLLKGTITLTSSWIPFPQRQYDQAVMSLAITSTYTKGELRQLNMCRIYLRVISVSDMTDFDGTRIKQSSYDGTRNHTHPTIRWPNQQRPTKRGWCVWQRCLLSISDHNRYLIQPLGN
jgi:hypothetical protein